MGMPMAMNVARRGFPLHVWNRTRDQAGQLTTLGAKVKVSPRECVEGARVIVTMLADEKALMDVLDGPNGILVGIERDAVLVEMSTIGRAAALRVAQMVKDAGARFIDAPVSGSPGPSESSELVALVGGKLNDITRAQPVLNAMCKRILHAGDVGQGQALKVLLSGVAVQQLAALTSMVALGEKIGLPRRILLEAFTTGTVATPAYAAKKDKLLSKDFTPEQTLEGALKDARLNVELQQEAGLPIAVHREVVRTLEKAMEEGLGAEDQFALEKYFKL
jgi:3-hydroxyisobutyrate dehydrogenase-like beta-hydroxyacid dehydrogenase